MIIVQKGRKKIKRISWKNRVIFKIPALSFHEILRECKKNRLTVSQIAFKGEYYVCSSDFNTFNKINVIAEKLAVRITVVEKKGASYYIHSRRKRYGFYIGALMAFILMIYLTSCIWVIEISGNTTTSTADIVRVLNKHGVGVGKLRYFKKISEIKNKSLLELDSLSWLWVTIDGTKAFVEVREKEFGKEIFSKDDYCNLVASYPGQIVDMRVRHGRKVVVRNAVVDKGQLLVSGISETKYKGNRYMHSDGEVWARTWRTKSAEYSLSNDYQVFTGDKTKVKTLNILGFKIKNIFADKPDYQNYKKYTKTKQFKILNNIYLPLTFTTEEFCEIITRNEILTKEEALQRAVKFLEQKICNERDNSGVSENTSYTCSELENGNIYVTVTVESLENIAKKEKIDIDTLEEKLSGENN